ncbi:MAG: aromatic ring-hydroxylating dioxygenase subunit alpha [Actinomycetota bacterium]|nr:aromatic ring-hydroxylating dioxygenase subunit alpha [Actinomycetota bacterium]
MRRDAAVGLGRRLLDYLECGSTYVADEVVRNPVAAYLDEDQWRAERSVLFGGNPIVVAMSGELRHPGDWVTLELPDRPLVTVRGEDGVARVFVNACSHRGVELCHGRDGHGRRLVCPFHAWTYDTSGALANVPDAEAVSTVDAAEFALTELPSIEMLGLVWLAPNGVDVEAHLGAELVAELDHLGLADHYHFRATTLPVASNWKLMYDTFLEFYHGVYAHQATLAQLMQRNLVHFDRVGEHWRMAAAKKSIATLADTDEADWDPLAHMVVSYDIFPNLAINLHGDHVAVYRLVPHQQRPDRCVWHFSMLTPEEPKTDKAIAYLDKNFDYIVATGREDVAMAESTQRTLASGANEALTYSRYEPVLGWYHRRVATQLASANAPGPDLLGH